ncbi:flagellar filament capping protein FliD [Pseudorhodoferax soli]|uniref:Flagellar hook-associated protein 2 n=1 Tax=Pseudorhodoferax soli TaxID=545864 RepID=A0A368XKA5_9BURK|nr:flagellar filament capping protein FliD [Pseudorhodoferax soli]RCW67616.1 flagellar hook-associated protein 2 [Pseudorhodoferax soli]
MAITSVGIGSGLEVEDIISKLVALEKKPLEGLQAKAEKIQTKVSSFAEIKSLVSTLQDAASKLALDSGWNALAVKSSKESAVSVSVSGIAAATSFSVGVQKLAQSQSTVSTAISAGGTIGSGQLTLELGSWNAGVFTAGTAAAVNVTVGANDTLAQVAAKINDSGAGVVATVLSDASGDRLMLRSKDTGAVSGFRITAADSDGNNADNAGLSRLAFDLAQPTVGMAANTYQAAQDAVATINGITVTSAKNQLVNAVPGLTISLNEVTPVGADALITSTVDKEAMTKNIQEFVDAYNAINTLLADSTKYDSETKTAGDLQGDSTAVGLRNSLRSVLTANGGSGNVFNSLSDIGITMARDGNLAINGSKLSTSLGDLENVKKLFIQRNEDGSSTGLAARMKSYTGTLLSFDGLLNNKTDALGRESDRNLDQQDKINDRATLAEARLRKTYTALDVKMGSLQALANYMDQQVSQWNKKND